MPRSFVINRESSQVTPSINIISGSNDMLVFSAVSSAGTVTYTGSVQAGNYSSLGSLGTALLNGFLQSKWSASPTATFQNDLIATGGDYSTSPVVDKKIYLSFAALLNIPIRLFWGSNSRTIGLAQSLGFSPVTQDFNDTFEDPPYIYVNVITNEINLDPYIVYKPLQTTQKNVISIRGKNSPYTLNIGK
jgi:hypothetical protein